MPPDAPFGPPSPAGATTEVCRIAIVGAGFSGIGMAIRLKQAGIDDFLLLEQAGEIGGTWRDNTYPGCACDIPAHLYSFSFAPRCDWSRRYPSQAEVQRYLVACIERFSLRPHLRLGTRLRTAQFDPAAAIWRLDTESELSVTAGVMVLGLGMLHRPAIPAIPGLETFRGDAFHTARWNHAITLNGRDVAVIGTGASAIQVVPHVAEEATQLTLFQRTPAWILPKDDPPVGAWRQRALRHVPLLRRALRDWLYWSHELRAMGFVLAPRLLEAAERRARSHAKRQLVDGALRERLTPEYRIGCKRILLSNDFLPALNRPNVRLVTAPITRIAPEGVVTADGATCHADVLVFATGFQSVDPLGAVRIVNGDGTTLQEAWRNGMQARLGLAVAGFPNLFLLGGPNTGLGHNSVVFMLEAQIGHILRCLRWMERRRASVIVLRAKSQARFQQWLDVRMQRTVWLTGCRSWYLDPAGHNTTLWPGFTFGYWIRTRVLRVRDYALRAAGRAGDRETPCDAAVLSRAVDHETSAPVDAARARPRESWT